MVPLEVTTPDSLLFNTCHKTPILLFSSLFIHIHLHRVFLPLCHHEDIFLPMLFPHLSVKYHHPDLSKARNVLYRTILETQIARFLNHVSHFLQPALSPIKHPCLALNTAAGSMWSFFLLSLLFVFYETRTLLYQTQQTQNKACRKRWSLSLSVK